MKEKLRRSFRLWLQRSDQMILSKGDSLLLSTCIIPYFWSLEIIPPLLQLYQPRNPLSAISNTVKKSSVCFCWLSFLLSFFFYFRRFRSSGGFDNHWSWNKNSIMSLFLEAVVEWEKETSSFLFSSSELLYQLSTSLHYTLRTYFDEKVELRFKNSLPKKMIWFPFLTSVASPPLLHQLHLVFNPLVSQIHSITQEKSSPVLIWLCQAGCLC